MKDIIEKLEKRIQDERTPIDREARFDEMLDEIYSFEKIGGPFEHMSPSRVLKEVDPIAYNCGVSDWADGENWVEVGSSSDTYDLRECEDIKDEMIAELEKEQEDAETEVEELETNESRCAEEGVDFVDTDALADARLKVEDCKSDIAELRHYSF